MSNKHLFIKAVSSFGEAKLREKIGSEAVFEFDLASGLHVYFSNEIEQVTGYTAEELIEKEFHSIIVETKKVASQQGRYQSYYSLLEARLQGDVSKSVAEYLVATKTGEYISIKETQEVAIDPLGNTKIIGSIKDITAEKTEIEKMQSLLEKATNLDVATRLGNRDAFFKSITHELKRVERSYEAMSVMVVSIDNFFEYQNHYGKDFTDRTIFQIARTLKQSIRSIDAAFRIGDGEFAMTLPYTNLAGAELLINRLQGIFARTIARNLSDKTPLQYTLNYGAASATSGNSKSVDLYKDALVNMFIASQPEAKDQLLSAINITEKANRKQEIVLH